MDSTPKILREQLERADGVRTRWETVTPEMATKWLEGNTHNRPIRPTCVDRYAADMKAGRWRQTHQGIAFSKHNVLLDGQHRLWAVVESAVPVVLQVTTGLPEDAQMFIDDGIKRSVVDIMRLAGGEQMSSINSLHSAIATRMYMGMVWSSDAKLTRQGTAEFIRDHWDALDFTVRLFPTSKRIKGVMSAGLLGVFARAYYHESKDDLKRFAQIMIDGIPQHEYEHAAIKFRTWLMQRKSNANAGSSGGDEIYQKGERILDAFCRRIGLGRNLTPVTAELYPLPKETAVRRRQNKAAAVAS